MMKRKVSQLLGFALALAFLINVASFASDFDKEQFKKNLPKLLGANNVGTDFYLTFHPCWETYNPNNAVKIYVSSGTRTLVTLEVPGQGHLETKMTIPNDVIEFSLYPGLAQCYSKTDRQKPLPEQIFPGRGIHVYANDPIIVYGVTRYEYTSDGFLALPTSSLGKEYIVAAYADPVTENFGVGQYLPAYTSVVAAYDNTRVRFTMGGNVWSKTAGGLKPGESTTVTMQAGDVFLVAGSGPRGDLSGSKIIATKPVGVISGNFCAYIPSEYGYCDFIIEMELPTNTWGKKYHVSQIATRRKNSLLKIFAKEPMTTLFRNGRQMGRIQHAGGTEGLGYFEIRYDEELNKPWVWAGDKPISVTQYNPGQSYDNVVSDPFQLVLTPIEQYQPEIVFNTPGIRGGFGYPDNYINIVYLGEENGEIPDDLEFASVSAGQFTWRKVSSISPTGGFPFIDDEQIGRKYYSKTLLLPGDGVYKLRAKDPFAAYAYGFSNYDSYGFPTSVALGDLEKPDTVAPHPVWKMDCGNIVGATVTDKPDDPAVRSNLALIIFHKDESFNYKFKFEPFVAGQDEKTKWEATVIDPLQDARAVITFTDRRGNDTTIVLEYFTTKLAIEPTFYDFGLLQSGEFKDQTFRLINKSKGMAEIRELKFQKADQNFSLHDYVLPRQLAPEEAMEFRVRFTANADGEFRDSIGAGDLCVFEYLAFVQARVGQPTIEVSDANWGDMTVGTTEQRNIEIRNYGSTDLIITGYSGPFDPDNVYVPSGLKQMTAQDPLIIKPGDFYTFKVNFTPKDQKAYPDRIIFHSNAKKTDSIAELWGRGILASLIANSEDWGKKRIHRDAFPAGPYDPPNNKVIMLKNNGTADAKIINIAIEDEFGDGDSFIFNRNAFLNLTVKAKDSAYIPVTFLPKRVGMHRIKITYPGNTAGSDTYTVLEGIGILGKIATFDMDFGTTVIQDMADIKKRKIRVTNTPYSDKNGTDVSDDVTITDLNIQPNNSISTNLTQWGADGFRFDIQDLYHSGLSARTKLPVTLKPDEYIEIDAEFVAQKAGDHKGSFTTVSDAEQNVTSNWTGFGVAQGVFATGGSSLICVYESEIINCEVGNSGSGVVTVTSVKLSPQLAEFSFIDPSVESGFELGPGETKQIQVRFSPTIVGTPATQLVIENTTLEEPVIYAQIRGEAVHYRRMTNNTNTTSNNKVISGEGFYYSINLEPGQDLTLADVKEFSTKIQYKKDFVVALQNEIHIGSAINNDFDMTTQINIIDQENNIEEITLIFTAKTGRFLNTSGEIAKIGFRSFLPWYTTDATVEKSRDTSVTITYDVAVIGTKCLDIDNDQVTITLEPTCVTNLRPIKISGTQYAFQQIAPNPVGPNGAALEFAVALQGWTEIRIINSAGDVVDIPVAADLAPGVYNVPLPVDKLSSGAYVCTISSGPFYDQQKIIINK